VAIGAEAMSGTAVRAAAAAAAGAWICATTELARAEADAAQPMIKSTRESMTLEEAERFS
jgi:hypothetical protein